MRIGLGDQKHLLAPPLDRLAHHLLRPAIGIHLGGVDQCQAKIQAQPQGADFGRTVGIALAHIPTALADGGNFGAIRQADVMH